MSVKIRLARHGSHKRPFYRLVVADSRSPRDGKFIERIGYFSPLTPKGFSGRIFFAMDRLEYWRGVGAKCTDRIARLEKEFLESKDSLQNTPSRADLQQAALDALDKKQPVVSSDTVSDTSHVASGKTVVPDVTVAQENNASHAAEGSTASDADQPSDIAPVESESAAKEEKKSSDAAGDIDADSSGTAEPVNSSSSADSAAS